MVETAFSMDEKWLTADRAADLKDLELRQIYTDLKQHLGFDGLGKNGKVKAPSIRKHSYTWKLSRFSENGSPISREAAKQVKKGTNVVVILSAKASNICIFVLCY